MHDVAVLHGLGHPLGHRPTELGEVVARPAAVEHALGVVHLAVAEEMDDRFVAFRGPRGIASEASDFVG